MPLSTIPTPGLIINAPQLPTIQQPNTVSTGPTASVKTGFDIGSLIDSISGIAGKLIDYNTAKLNAGNGAVYYANVPTTTANTAGGFDLSNPIVIGAIALGVYFLVKK